MGQAAEQTGGSFLSLILTASVTYGMEEPCESGQLQGLLRLVSCLLSER